MEFDGLLQDCTHTSADPGHLKTTKWATPCIANTGQIVSTNTPVPTSGSGKFVMNTFAFRQSKFLRNVFFPIVPIRSFLSTRQFSNRNLEKNSG